MKSAGGLATSMNRNKDALQKCFFKILSSFNATLEVCTYRAMHIFSISHIS